MFRTATFSIVLALASAATLFAQRPGGGFGFGFGGPDAGGGELFLLRNADVQKELELLDDQVKKLDGISDKFRDQMQDMWRGLGDLSREDREKKMEENREKMRTAAADLQKQVDGILLPHQSKRLKQIGVQQRMRFGGGGANSDAISRELKLSDADKKKLQDKAEAVEKSLREKLSKARKEAEDELLSVLSPEQRAQWKDLTGDPFELRFGGFGGRGGSGGGGGPGGAQGRRPGGN